MKTQEQYNELKNIRDMLIYIPEKHLELILNKFDFLQNEINETNRLLANKEEDWFNKRDECEMLTEAYEDAVKSLIAEQCTMNHQDNTEYEKGQINGLLTALKIIKKSFRKD